ncbi:nucleotide exchange factor GrpE [Candidatus Marsarchaeota archaeon]|nr:nucleotide exchange factor GrpE [Candidatus Marsarchaeota archaeon]
MSEENKDTNNKQENQNDKALEELNDRHLRLAAEFDNYKKRTMKDVENSRKSGKAELVLKLLPVLDEFEIAISSIENTNSKKGIELIFSNFVTALRNEGLSEINAEGIYDPYKHEIIMVAESNEAEGTIIETVRKGYMFNGIMLRPASVIISKPKNPEEKENK